MNKELHYKVFNGRNQLIFVSPVRRNVILKLEELLDIKFESDEKPKISGNNRTFVEGYRIEGSYI